MYKLSFDYNDNSNSSKCVLSRVGSNACAICTQNKGFFKPYYKTPIGFIVCEYPNHLIDYPEIEIDDINPEFEKFNFSIEDGIGYSEKCKYNHCHVYSEECHACKANKGSFITNKQTKQTGFVSCNYIHSITAPVQTSHFDRITINELFKSLNPFEIPIDLVERTYFKNQKNIPQTCFDLGNITTAKYITEMLNKLSKANFDEQIKLIKDEFNTDND